MTSLPVLLLGLLCLGTVFASSLRYADVACNGTIAECSEEEEMAMESEISRRILAGKKYITPGAMKPDQPVCRGGGRGQPYSKAGDCLPGSSNPPQRGCQKYYRCRSDS